MLETWLLFRCEAFSPPSYIQLVASQRYEDVLLVKISEVTWEQHQEFQSQCLSYKVLQNAFFCSQVWLIVMELSVFR